MKLLLRYADNKNPASVASSFRNKRLHLFLECCKQLPRPIRIIDIGGTIDFWKNNVKDLPHFDIWLINLEDVHTDIPNLHCLKGDATNLSAFANQSFDIAFSNSVIEHLYTWENQCKMAGEVTRVAKYHFIQTPNYWFPIEPHWVLPFFQYLPKFVRILLTRMGKWGHIDKAPDLNEAKRQVSEIQLLSKRQMQKLFPESFIYAEKFMGLNKSFVALNFNGKLPTGHHMTSPSQPPAS